MILAQLLVEGKVVHMFIGKPDETAYQLRDRIMESLALTMVEVDEAELPASDEVK